jgi:hypothetical protein
MTMISIKKLQKMQCKKVYIKINLMNLEEESFNHSEILNFLYAALYSNFITEE